MARSRRPRGFGPDLRGTLGTLVRSTLAQAGVVRDVLERGAREGRARLDDVRRDRRRDNALAQLGEAVMDALRAGQLAEAFEVPAIADAIAELELIERAEAETVDESPRSWAPTTRGPRYDHDDAREPAPRVDRSDEPGARFRTDDRGDGTVSSASWRPPPRSAAATPAPARAPVTRPAPAKPAPAKPAARAGGIQFGAADGEDDPDADLAQYMHPDDVPPRGPEK